MDLDLLHITTQHQQSVNQLHFLSLSRDTACSATLCVQVGFCRIQNCIELTLRKATGCLLHGVPNSEGCDNCIVEKTFYTQLAQMESAIIF